MSSALFDLITVTECDVCTGITGICAFVEYIAVVYAELRQEEASSKMPHSYTTARTLMSILRLSQALARLRFSQIVLQVGSSSLALVSFATTCRNLEVIQPKASSDNESRALIQPRVDLYSIAVAVH